MKKQVMAVLVSLMLAACTNGQQAQQPPAPTTLTAKLENLHVVSSGIVEGDVTIENKGPNNSWIATGVKAGNDGAFFASQFDLYATDFKGNAQKLYTPGPNYAFNGALQTVALPLPVKSTQTVHVQWGLNKGHGAPASSSLLIPGTYKFHAVYKGKSADTTQCAPCWIGEIKSNEVQLTVQ